MGKKLLLGITAASLSTSASECPRGPGPPGERGTRQPRTWVERPEGPCCLPWCSSSSLSLQGEPAAPVVTKGQPSLHSAPTPRLPQGSWRGSSWAEEGASWLVSGCGSREASWGQGAVSQEEKKSRGGGGPGPQLSLPTSLWAQHIWAGGWEDHASLLTAALCPVSSVNRASPVLGPQGVGIMLVE